MSRALVVDDKQLGRQALADELQAAGFEVHEAADAYAALDAYATVEPSVVVTDFQLPGLDGIALIEQIRLFSPVPAILITAYGSPPLTKRALEGGAHHVLDFNADLTRVGDLALDLVRQHAATGDSDRAVSTTREKRRRDVVQRAQLERLLRDCDGNVSEAARRANMSRGSLRYQLKRLRVLSGDGG